MKKFRQLSGLKEFRKALPNDIEGAEKVADTLIDKRKKEKFEFTDLCIYGDWSCMKPDYKRQNKWKKVRREQRKFRHAFED